jgi:hypothetical protein
MRCIRRPPQAIHAVCKGGGGGGQRLAVQEGCDHGEELVLPVQHLVQDGTSLGKHLPRTNQLVEGVFSHNIKFQRTKDWRRMVVLRKALATHTASEYTMAAFRLGPRRSDATNSKKVGRVEPSPPTVRKDIAALCCNTPCYSSSSTIFHGASISSLSMTAAAL